MDINGTTSISRPHSRSVSNASNKRPHSNESNSYTNSRPTTNTTSITISNAKTKPFYQQFLERDHGKEKTFYKDPFLTCSWCNELTFVDVVLLRANVLLPAIAAHVDTKPPTVNNSNSSSINVTEFDYELFNNTNSTYSHANNPLANSRPNSTSANPNLDTKSRPNTNQGNSNSRPSTNNSTDNSRPSTNNSTDNSRPNTNNNSRPNTNNNSRPNTNNNNNNRRNGRRKALAPDAPDAIVHIDPFEHIQGTNMNAVTDLVAIKNSIYNNHHYHLNEFTYKDDEDLSKKEGEIILHTSNNNEKVSIKAERLKACPRCGKTEYYVIGSHDFSAMIAERDRAAREKIRKERNAATFIQQFYRRYLRRMYGQAATKGVMARRLLEFRAACLINAGVRGRLARRIAITRKALLVIENAHQILVKHALKTKMGQTALFWYNRKEELEVLFDDYVLLCERTGFIPPRNVVEANIKEMAERIIRRKHEIIAIIQKNWRRVMARRVVRYYKSEVIRLRQTNFSKIMIIQRAYRGFIGRMFCTKLRADTLREKFMDDYQDFAQAKLLKKQFDKIKVKTKSAYIKEMAEEKTARLTRRIDLAEDHDDRKLKAWSASCYADDRLPKMIDQLYDVEFMKINEQKLKAEEERTRKLYLRNRIEEHGPTGFGDRGFIKEKPLLDVESWETRKILGDIVMSSRSKGMDRYFKNEMTDLVNKLAERAMHNFEGRDLRNRFKQYNDVRLIMKGVDLELAAKKEKNSNLLLMTAPPSPVKQDKSEANSPTRKSFGQGPKTLKTKADDGRRSRMRRAGEDVSIGNMFRPKEYKYPAEVYEDPLAYLFDDEDVIKRQRADKLEKNKEESTLKAETSLSLK